MIRLLKSLLLAGVAFTCSSLGRAEDGHRVLLQGNGRLAMLEKDGTISWEMPWGGIHDIHLLPNGHIMTQQNMKKVVEIEPTSSRIVWSYDASTMNGNAGRPVEVHAFQPLPDGSIMIAESGPGRIIEVARDGTLLKEVKMKIGKPHPHRDTRLARKLPGGTYLVCHEADGVVREYRDTGEVIWEFAVPLFDRAPKGGHGLDAFGNAVFGAIRLPSGNTLVATGNGHSVLEVDPSGNVVWAIHQDDLPGIRLAWVTTLELLPDNTLVIGNCHAGPGNPLLIKIDRTTKKVLWTCDEFPRFGNSVPNSLLADAVGSSIR
jgi:outer membrane protein assembly factor BamB